MKKSGSLLIFILLACFFETIEARCRENCEGYLGLFSPLQIFGFALFFIVCCVLACLKCYCKYKILENVLSNREESRRVSNTNGNGTSREDSVYSIGGPIGGPIGSPIGGPIGGYNGGPIGVYNGGFNREPTGGYSLPSIEAQHPQQQYTNTTNGPFTSRKDNGEPAGDYDLPPTYQECVGPIGGYNGGFNGEPAGGNNLPPAPREAQYPERGQYFLTGQFFTKNQESAV